RALKEDLAKASKEEELRVRQEEAERLSKLRVQLASETEAEKEQIRAEQEAALQRLREEWESLQVTEKENLEGMKKCVLEKLKLQMEDAQQSEMVGLEREKEQFLSEFKERLEREKKKATEELEKHLATELQELKSAAAEKHRKVISSLQTQIAEAQRNEEAQLREELQRAEQKIQQKAYQVTEYEREASIRPRELLREKRQAVEKEHERKMERMKEEHQEVLARIRDQYEEEERKQRAELSEGVRRETLRLRHLHDVEVKALQAELEERLAEQQQRSREKERGELGLAALKLQDSESELELRAKAVKAKSLQLLSEEEALRKKRQQLLEEARRTELEREEAALASELRLEENRKVHASLLDSIRQLRKSLEELRDQKAELEAQVDLLQTRRQRLQQRVSDLEVAIRSKEETLKDLEAEETVESARGKAELRVEDLGETIEARSSRTPASACSQSHDDNDFQFDHVRSYISAEGISIRNAKEFLVRQTRSMRKRHTALKAAKQQWRQDVQRAQEVLQDADSSQLLEGVRRNLEDEAKRLDKMKLAMRKGQVLLKKKEEKLSQLESSLLEELSDEDTLKSAACKKMVTFDLSNSEDTNSMSSVDVHQHPGLDQCSRRLCAFPEHGAEEEFPDREAASLLPSQRSLFFFLPLLLVNVRADVPLDSQLDKVQYLTSSLQRITSDAVAVLDRWAWDAGLSCGRAGAAAESSLPEKWHQYFPGGLAPFSGRSAFLDSRLAYVPADEQIRLFQHSQFRGSESDKMSIQGMIETNKKWLEDFKRDSEVPVLPGAQQPPAGSPSLLQLGLDENKRIKVFRY
ncbi:Centrosomal protein of 164 kDa, partial [Tinamus guttatus]